MNLKGTAFLLIGLLPLNLLAQSTPPQTRPMPPGMQGMRPPGRMEPVPMPDKEKMSYAIGMSIGTNIKRDELSVDVDSIATAIKDIMAGKATQLTDKEEGEVLGQLQRAMGYKRQAEAEENKAKADEFLATNSKAPGVKSLPSGLQYKVINEGTGELPKPNDTVTVNYRGTLIDGTEFDKREGFTTPVTSRNIIRGWQEVLPLMKAGAKWQIFIPPMLAYGPRGNPKIPGNSALIFDMEVTSITPGATPPPSRNTFSGARPPMPGANAPVVSGEIIKVPSAEELKKGAKIEVIKPGQTNAVNAQ